MSHRRHRQVRGGYTGYLITYGTGHAVGSNTVKHPNNSTGIYRIVGTGKYSFGNYGQGISSTPVTSPSHVTANISSSATSTSYTPVVAPDVQRRFEKVNDLKMPTTHNILEFWNEVDDPLFSEEMVLSKISIVAKKRNGAYASA